MQRFADGTSSSGSSRVRAIAMWDFSWIERRWPGAGYENWDEALDGLVARGYDAVRIDSYPQLLAADPLREWELLPVWNTQDWGCPASCKILLVPALFEFLAKCSERKLAVAFSTWFRQDTLGVRLRISEPRHHAEIWRRTLELLEAEGFLDTVLYVDLCNEWPLDLWAPFFTNGTAGGNDWATAASLSWMRQSIALLKLSYPQFDYCYSFTTHLHDRQAADVSFMDLLEPHVWMATCTDFNQRIGYGFERFDRSGYEKIQEFAAPLYQSDPEHWLNRLSASIGALVDYKDSPFLDWGWIKEICAHGVRACLATGRWMAVGTSNFCGPQFAGMWNDADWHRSLTEAIRGNSAPPLGLRSSRKSTLVT